MNELPTGLLRRIERDLRHDRRRAAWMGSYLTIVAVALTTEYPGHWVSAIFVGLVALQWLYVIHTSWRLHRTRRILAARRARWNAALRRKDT